MHVSSFITFCALAISSVVATPQNFIVNGTIVSTVIPYHAHILQRNSFNNQSSFGSGVLISTRHILTTATNIAGYNEWTVGFGSLNVSQLIYYTATGALVHEDYNPITSLNNIGILFMGTGINITGTNIVPASLPLLSENIPGVGVYGEFAAFGISPQGVQSNVLLYSRQIVLEQSACSAFLPTNSTTQFCSIDHFIFSTPCGGEQGAGFAIQHRNISVVVGIISGISETCESRTAMTFSIRISDYRLWLLSNIGV